MAVIKRVVGLIVVGLAVIIAGRIGWVAYGPRDDGKILGQQGEFLHQAIDDGAAGKMQELFPEGSYFLRALTASVLARSGGDLGQARALRDGLDAPESVAVFGSGMVPEHGIFSAGWSLMVAVDLASATGIAADRADVERRAVAVAAAIGGSRSGFLEGYPSQYWPCDTVVAASSLARAAVLLDRPDWLATLTTWRTTVSVLVEMRTGLLPHQVDASGQSIAGPRGSSQSIIQAFWPDLDRSLDGTVDLGTWARFREAFVVRKGGLIGVREFPRGVSGVGDVDSGPLITGVSLSASAVTLAAARAVGDTSLAADLDREADLLGMPMTLTGKRRYALGLLPTGDAFVAWGRSVPIAESIGLQRASEILGRPRWPVYIGGPLVVGAVAALGTFRRRRRRHTGPVSDL